MKVSILIPCYNCERWIAQAIQSALDQTHPEKEVIVVDDGSTDGSLDIIKSFAEQIRWESGPNRGGNVARNRLLELSTGEWVQHLDADDYFLPDKIANHLKFWSETNSDADVMYSPNILTWHAPDGKVTTTTTTIDGSRPIEELWVRWYVGSTGGTLWKRERLLSIGGWNESMPCCQDNELTWRAIRCGLRFLFCPYAGAVYRLWSNQTVSTKNPVKFVRVRTELIDEMLVWLRLNNRLSRSVEDAASQAFFEMARALAFHDLQQATQYRKNRLLHCGFKVAGPAASWSYKLVYLLAGFESSERLERFCERSVRLKSFWKMIVTPLRRAGIPVGR